MFLEACCRRFFCDKNIKPEMRSFGLKIDDGFDDIIVIKKKSLTEYRLPSWLVSHYVVNYNIKIALKRLDRS